MRNHRFAQPVRFRGRRLRHCGFETLEELVTVHPFVGQHPHRLPSLILVIDNDAGSLPSIPTHARRRRPIDHITAGPDTRTPHRPALHAVALGDHPIDGIVGYARACQNGKMEIDLAHPITQMAVAVDESRQNRFAFRVDYLRTLRQRYLAAFSYGDEPSVLHDDGRIRHRRASRPVDQRSADDGNGARLCDDRRTKRDDRYGNNDRHDLQHNFHSTSMATAAILLPRPPSSFFPSPAKWERVRASPDLIRGEGVFDKRIHLVWYN